MKSLSILLLATLACGCVSQKWAKYDASQFQVVMSPSEETITSHVDFLSGWSESKEGLPPGVGLELAYYLAQLGHIEEAKTLFSSELEAHPNLDKYAGALMRISMPQPSERADEEQQTEGPDDSNEQLLEDKP